MRGGTGTCGDNKQFWRCANALFWGRHIGDIQCAVCIFGGAAETFAWHLDVHISGAVSVDADDNAEKICAVLYVQFCCGICVW